MDILLKDVPVDAADAVKEMVAISVERFHRKEVVPTAQLQETFEVAVDAFRVKNGLPKKFDVVSVTPVEPK